LAATRLIMWEPTLTVDSSPTSLVIGTFIIRKRRALSVITLRSRDPGFVDRVPNFCAILSIYSSTWEIEKSCSSCVLLFYSVWAVLYNPK
jgi:hypothetical protein